MAKPSVTADSRVLPVAFRDRDSELRTPSRPLHRLPPQVRDPFLPQPPSTWLRFPPEMDLTRLAPDRPQADGTPIVVTGRILDEELRPVRRALIEIWNCNTYGRYSHIDDSRNPESPLDPNFYGFGRLCTDDDGRYALRTIQPAPYVARRDVGWWRPPHLHFSVLGGGVRLVTQMYLPGEPLNAQDFIFNVIPAAERPRVLATPILGGGPDPKYVHDIVVRGRFQTPFDRDLPGP